MAKDLVGRKIDLNLKVALNEHHHCHWVPQWSELNKVGIHDSAHLSKSMPSAILYTSSASVVSTQLLEKVFYFPHPFFTSLIDLVGHLIQVLGGVEPAWVWVVKLHHFHPLCEEDVFERHSSLISLQGWSIHIHKSAGYCQRHPLASTKCPSLRY